VFGSLNSRYVWLFISLSILVLATDTKILMPRPHTTSQGSTGHTRIHHLADDEDLFQDFSALGPECSKHFDESFLWNDTVPVLPSKDNFTLPHSPTPFLKPSVPIELDFDFGFDEPITSDFDAEGSNSAKEPYREYAEGLVWTNSRSSLMDVDNGYAFSPSLSLPALHKDSASIIFTDDKLKLNVLPRPDYQRLQGSLIDIEVEGTDRKLLQNEYQHHSTGQSPDIVSQAQDAYQEERIPGLESGSQATAIYYLAPHSPATLAAANCSTIVHEPAPQGQEGLSRPALFDVQKDEYLPAQPQYIDQHVQIHWDTSQYFEISCDTDSDLLDFDAGDIGTPEVVIYSTRDASHRANTLLDTCPVNIHQWQPDSEHKEVNVKPRLGVGAGDDLHWKIDTDPCAVGAPEEWEEHDQLLLVDFEDVFGDC
jgi:hypothetical protein